MNECVCEWSLIVLYRAAVVLMCIVYQCYIQGPLVTEVRQEWAPWLFQVNNTNTHIHYTFVSHEVFFTDY